MSIQSFYDLGSGLFTGNRFFGPADLVASNTPAGCGAVAGEYDPGEFRVDLPTGQVVAYQPPAPPNDAMQTWAWDATALRWVSTPTLAAVVAAAQTAIDDAAGAARARYITDVTGQQAVYLRKADQAKEFADANFTGTPPPYIAVEAAARGMTPAALAQQILATASQWDDQLSPAIEAQRVAGKAAASACTTTQAVQASAQATVAALNAF